MSGLASSASATPCIAIETEISAVARSIGVALSCQRSAQRRHLSTRARAEFEGTRHKAEAQSIAPASEPSDGERDQSDGQRANGVG